jgi:hypothetical protein
VGFENVRAEQNRFFIVTASKADDLMKVRQW